MAPSKKQGNRLETNYTEDVVGIALDSFLSIANFPRLNVTIEPFSKGEERWLGADARIVNEISGFKPFYMQFKRPSAYPDFSTSSIIKHRKSLSLDISPYSLFFKLREKDKDHADFQHNVLYRWRNRLKKYANSDAIYVCPIFLDRSAYRFHLHQSALIGWWGIRGVTIEDYGKQFRFADVPFLAEHVCIPPHTLVTNAKHRYSFTENGTDLCFHSPTSLPDGITQFGSWFDSLSGDIASGDFLVRVENAKDRLKQLIAGDGYEEDVIPYPDGLFEIEDGMAAWSEWGRFLRETYSIHQYFFIVWNER